MPEFMPDFVNIDHRRARGFAPGDLTAYMRATWDLAPDVIAYAEAVHRLSNLGAVFTQAVSGTSQDGFEAEWREIVLATVDGNLINRIELFEEADIDAALTRFDSSAGQRHGWKMLQTKCLSATLRTSLPATGTPWPRYWPTTLSTDDRRRVVNAGVRHGRDAEIANMQAFAEVGTLNITLTVIATRGERLVLVRDLFVCPRLARGLPHRGAQRHGDQRRQPDLGPRHCSTPTTSTPPSRSSTRATSPAKRPPTRTRGRSSSVAYAAFNRREYPRRRRTG